MRRLTLGRIAMTSMSKIWKDSAISKSTKTRLVRALVFPIALYGCESWTTRKTEKKKIASFENWCWRRMLRVSWTDRRTNASIDEEIGSGTTLLNQALKQKLSYFGHVVRADGLEKSLMLGMGEGKRNRGRPRARWMDEILERTGLGLREATQAARERTTWRRVVSEVTRGLQRPDGTR